MKPKSNYIYCIENQNVTIILSLLPSPAPRYCVYVAVRRNSAEIKAFSPGGRCVLLKFSEPAASGVYAASCAFMMAAQRRPSSIRSCPQPVPTACCSVLSFHASFLLRSCLALLLSGAIRRPSSHTCRGRCSRAKSCSRASMFSWAYCRAASFSDNSSPAAG